MFLADGSRVGNLDQFPDLNGLSVESATVGAICVRNTMGDHLDFCVQVELTTLGERH
jgi:hypothetical protein